jgi:hypothetical protein
MLASLTQRALVPGAEGTVRRFKRATLADLY